MSELLKDLADVVPLARAAQHNDAFTLGRLTGFTLTHHATIQQNAEDAKRLRALERAITEFGAITGQLDDVASIGKRATEILREGEPHDQD